MDVALLEHCLRDDLNPQVPRVMCVLRPLRVVIENYPEGETEELEAPLYPHDVPREGSRQVPFARVLYVERDDFAENPPKGFHRLTPGREVRLRYGYLVRCERAVKDANGDVVEIVCTYDPETRGGAAPDGRKVPGTIHWVSAEHSLPVEVRLYDRLFSVERPDLAEGGFEQTLNPASLETLTDARIEPAAGGGALGERLQFERQGYFFLDPQSFDGRPVYNRIVPLRDSWAKEIEKQALAAAPLAERRAARAAVPVEPKVAEPLSLEEEEELARVLPALEPVVRGLLAAHPAEVERYRAGRTGLLGFFVAQVMKAAAGKANPRLVNEILTRELGAARPATGPAPAG